MERDISKVLPSEAGHVGSLYGSPYYLLVDGKPLPLAVHEANPVALQWRDEWSALASQEAKEYCGFDGENWIGGLQF